MTYDQLDAEVARLRRTLAASAIGAERAMQPVMPEPDWATAPDWAVAWTHDFNGYSWHEFKPYLNFNSEWRPAYRKSSGRRKHPRRKYVSSQLPLGLDPRLSLRTRPGVNEEEL